MISLFETLRDTWEEPWHPVGTAGLAIASIGFCLLFLVALTAEQGWIPLLDGANLLFHEAGHPLFGVLGWETLTVLGGTLMQLLIPVVVATSFWLRRDAYGTAAAGIWAFENLLNIARYVADARAQVLPLVGGGEHDWTALLGGWGFLSQDIHIAQGIRAFGWLGMMTCWAWLILRWHVSRRG